MYRLEKMLLITAAVIFTLCLMGGRAYAYSSVGTVKCTGYLNVRRSAGTSAKIIDKLYPGTKVSIIGSSNGWYKVTHGKTTGWVSGKYISKASSATGTASREGCNINNIVEYAKKLLGIRYVYGGSSLKGFDCSGFTAYVYKNFGIGLNRQASSQALQGISVKKSNLQPGDLVFFDTNGGHNDVSHVGIYIGNNRFIHAESGAVGRVTVDSLGESYYARTYMTARRVIG